MNIEGISFTVVNVELLCSLHSTPWCDCTQSVNNSNKERRKEILRSIPAHDVIAPKINFKEHISPDG